MKKALIIGAAGFVGNYLINQILKEGHWSVSATKLMHENIETEGIEIYNLDIMNQKAIEELLLSVKPDFIFHLAAQSSVALSWKKPDLTIDINIKGSIHVLDAIRMLEYKPRVLLIGSGEEYGHIRPEETPVSEETLERPGNIYAATKACQNMIGRIYVSAYGMDIVSVRAFNHIGPNQAPLFVVADFCKQVAAIEKGEMEPVIRVGNLSAKRDFTDVRDVVRAYCLLIESGVAGETYNVGSGKAISIQTILDNILYMSDKDIKVELDELRLRPVDVPIIEADISKLVECTGWNRNIPLQQTLKETLNWWRSK